MTYDPRPFTDDGMPLMEGFPTMRELGCFGLNGDWQRRDTLIFGNAQDWSKAMGGITRFDLDVANLERLVAEKFVNPAEGQNFGPEVSQFLTFMKKWPQVKAVGYAVSPERDDYRVSIDGLVCKDNITPELMEEFNFWRDADEYENRPDLLSAWWD